MTWHYSTAAVPMYLQTDAATRGCYVFKRMLLHLDTTSVKLYPCAHLGSGLRLDYALCGSEFLMKGSLLTLQSSRARSKEGFRDFRVH
eukprot:49672-Rhodomonas_salina.2